jgi:hypothetical protein
VWFYRGEGRSQFYANKAILMKENLRKWFSEHDQHYPKNRTNGDVSVVEFKQKVA